MHDLCRQGAIDLAGLIAARKVSASEVLEAHLARIAEVNPAVNAITTVLADRARAVSLEVDRSIAAGEEIGPLAGVPFTVKGNIDVAESETTWGVAAMAAQVATHDAPLVARMRSAGAIPIARTNLPDFAFRWDTDSQLSGRTLNPWDAARTAGGSSGGEAAALATGMTPLGFGNDLGGSLRLPSQFCGTAAIRPTRGRVADAAVTMPEPLLISQMANCQGPMARKVEDLRLALRLISAPDARDPRWVPAPSIPERVSSTGIRVAVVRNPSVGGIDPSVAEGIDRAAGWLADAGYDVVDREPPQLAEALQVWVDALWADVSQRWPLMKSIVGAGAIGFVNALLEHGLMRAVDQQRQQQAWIDIHRIGREWSMSMATHPIILAPICCEPAWLAGEDITRVVEIRAAMRMVMPVNILGLPSCAVPVGLDLGLPQGVQLIGVRFGEGMLLDAAQAIEDRAPSLTPIDPRASRTPAAP